MFSKHVWYDRRHQAEVFITSDGIVSGTILAFRGAVTLVNPRPEILAALYQEAKIKRILSLRTVILTDNTIDFARGLCVLLNYSRGLRRRSSMTVITRDDTSISTEFLHSCCSRLLDDSALFDVSVRQLATDESYAVGAGRISFERLPQDTPEYNPRLVVRTDDQVLHYLDESHLGGSEVAYAEKPSVVIRTAEFPRIGRESRHMLNVLG